MWRLPQRSFSLARPVAASAPLCAPAVPLVAAVCSPAALLSVGALLASSAFLSRRFLRRRGARRGTRCCPRGLGPLLRCRLRRRCRLPRPLFARLRVDSGFAALAFSRPRRLLPAARRLGRRRHPLRSDNRTARPLGPRAPARRRRSWLRCGLCRDCPRRGLRRSDLDRLADSLACSERGRSGLSRFLRFPNPLCRSAVKRRIPDGWRRRSRHV